MQCGTAGCSCRTGGRKHGPYWYAYFKDRRGRLRKRYVGKLLRRLPDDPEPKRSVRHVHSHRPFEAKKPRKGAKKVKESPAVLTRNEILMEEARQVVRTASGLRSSSIGLVFVPTLAQALGARIRSKKSVELAHTAILKAAHAGLLELRPESGLGRLSAEELALCIPGPQQTRLSWARVLS